MRAKVAVITAGGTGGHMFPAQALAEMLMARGWQIALATDERGERYTDKFPAQKRIILSAATYQAGDGLGMARAGLSVARGVWQARAALAIMDPSIVIGFGGYPSLPGLLAGLTQGRRTLLHEQNAVLGRVNRLLAPYVTEVAAAFPTFLPKTIKSRRPVTVVGNPVRPEIRALFDLPYVPPWTGEAIRVLITGGSQGARLLSELVPRAIQLLPESLRIRLEVQQQTRAESMEAARAVYTDALVKAEIAPFFRDMAGRLSAAHLVIGRSGASTVCELAVAGRPSVLVPLKIAADDHQTYNAKLLADAGAASVWAEDDLTIEGLAGSLSRLLQDPEALLSMARAAKSVALPDATERLADLAERTASGALGI